MSIQASIAAQTPPAGVAWHASPAEHLQWIVEYLRVVMLTDFKGINFGSTTPSADDRDKPWYRISADGSLMGWYAWDGSEWATSKLVHPNGPTASRPESPAEGTVYYDSDIRASIIYERNMWRLNDGASPGTLKFWDGATMADALAANPGYSIFAKMNGRSPMGAGLGEGLTERVAQATIGAETHALTADQNGKHTHGFSVSFSSHYEGTATPGDGGDTANSSWAGTTSSSGNGEPHNNIHPVYVCWVLRKD